MKPERTDITKRLRDTYSKWNNPPSPGLPDDARIVLEAADEIDRLRAKVEAAEAEANAQADEGRRIRRTGAGPKREQYARGLVEASKSIFTACREAGQ